MAIYSVKQDLTLANSTHKPGDVIASDEAFEGANLAQLLEDGAVVKLDEGSDGQTPEEPAPPAPPFDNA